MAPEKKQAHIPRAVGEPQSGGYNYVLRQGGLVKNLVWDVK
jgi:hypothetical protein